MTNDEHKAYLNDRTQNGTVLFYEILSIDDDIAELEERKKALIRKFTRDNKILNEGDRLELIWPNGITEIIDIHTPAASKVMHEVNEYDIVYGYRKPNKDGSKAKTGALRTLWQGQLFKNGYKKI